MREQARSQEYQNQNAPNNNINYKINLEKYDRQYDHELGASETESNSNQEEDLVIFYSLGNDVSSIQQQDSQYLIEDIQDQDDQAQLLSNLTNRASAGVAGGAQNYDQRLLKQRQETSINNLSTKAAGEYKRKNTSESSNSQFSCWKVFPSFLFFGLVTSIVLFCIFDLKDAMKWFNQFIEWIKIHPYQSIGYSIYLLCFSVIFAIPISYTIVILGYTYAQVFDSKLYGLLFTIPIVYFGCLLGGMISFLLSRYLFKDFIKQQIQGSPWLAYNFRMMNEIITTEGMKIVGLMRLTFAPFGITSYVFGVSEITFSDYMLGNLSYIINSCTQSFIGCSLYTASQKGDINQIHSDKIKFMEKLPFIIEICVTVIVTIIIGYISKNIIEKKLMEEEEKQLAIEQNSQHKKYYLKGMPDQYF